MREKKPPFFAGGGGGAALLLLAPGIGGGPELPFPGIGGGPPAVLLIVFELRLPLSAPAPRAPTAAAVRIPLP